MHIWRLHEWAVSPAQARDMQSDLARQVRLTPMGCRPVTVAGLDCTFSRDGNRVFAVAVVLALPGLEVIESTHVVMSVRFPYIPGHKCNLQDAIAWTLRCTTRYRLPEPTRLAHQMVGKLRC
jgi:deoxyinosine 3'endonuclease (endonuclease V)